MSAEDFAFIAGCVAFALMLPRILRSIRRNWRLEGDAAEFLRGCGVSSVAELRARAEASRCRQGHSGPPSGWLDVSNYAEGRKAVRRRPSG